MLVSHSYNHITHHFAIVDRRIDLVIPTGAMGNITGGYMAKQMGVPIGMLCAGVNINGNCVGVKLLAMYQSA